MSDPENKIVPLRRSDLMSIVSGAGLSDYVQEKIQYTPNDEAAKLKELNNKHAVVIDRGGNGVILSYDTDPVTNRVTYTYLKQEQFLLKYCNQSMVVSLGADKTVAVELGKWWLKHINRREYAGITYDPEHIEKDQWGAHVKNGKLNMWTGFGVEPVKGCWKRMFRHCYETICKKDRDKFKYLIRWMAWAIQNPGKMAGTAIVIRGKKGTGKSILGNALCKIFGDHSSILTNSEHLIGKFNAHLETSSFVFSDEAYYPDNESDGVLKSIITEQYFTIEAKYQTPRKAKNCIKVFMCTNYERAVNASVDERRYFVCETDDKYCPSGANRKKGEEYFSNLYRELEFGGLPAMMYDLMNMELGDFNPIWSMPRTTELDKQIFMGIRNWDRVVYEFLQAGFFPGKPNLRVGASDLLEYIQRTFPVAKSIKDYKLYTDSLEKAGVTKKRTGTGYMYIFPSLPVARAKWQERNGRPPEEWALNEDGSEAWNFRTDSKEPEY